MKKIIFTTFSILCFFMVQGQETYYILAQSGLIVRQSPSIHSKRIGKLPYGSTVELLEKTEIKHHIIDNGNTINGFWYKIKFSNFPYIVSEVDSYNFEDEGYVFNGFIEKLAKTSIDTKEIDSLRFYQLYKKPIATNMEKITSHEEIEKLLDSRVKWKYVENLGLTIDKIILDSGQILSINQESNDYGLVAYYPSEEVLLFEGGHTSDFSISIKTGETLETVGNPKYIVESPNKKFRLNGWFPGQECSSYFFQEKIGNNYTYLINFGWDSDKFGENVCNFNNFCWLEDGKFIYSYTDYTGEKGEEKYFMGEIRK